MYCIKIYHFSFSIYVCSAFGHFLSKTDLPYLALPFNMIIVCTFLTIQPITQPEIGINLVKGRIVLLSKRSYNYSWFCQNIFNLPFLICSMLIFSNLLHYFFLRLLQNFLQNIMYIIWFPWLLILYIFICIDSLSRWRLYRQFASS